MVDSFITAVKQSGGGPVINGNVASFVYQGSAASAVVSGDFNGWGTSTAMTKLAGTNLFYYQQSFEMNARLDYKFIIPTNNYILDPLNSHYCNGGYGPNSELAMPSYIQPWEIIARNVAHGALVSKSLASTNLSATYQIYIYLPPGYSASDNKRYPTVYFHDALDYLNLASAQNVIENCIDSNKITPFIGVFIQPINRNDEMMGTKRDAYRLFVAKEVVPYIDANYKTIAQASERTVIGTSLGGNISALIVYYHPDIFSKCGLHSAAFWVNNYEAITFIQNAPPPGIKYFAAWGTYEDTYQWMRPFRDSLKKHGFAFGWSERPEGHSWGLWRATLDSMLSFLLPASTTSDIKQTADKGAMHFSLSSCYPNPFNSTASIQYELQAQAFVDISIFSSTGKMVKTVLHEQQGPGSKTFHIPMNGFSSGTYFLRMSCGNEVQTRTLVLIK